MPETPTNGIDTRPFRERKPLGNFLYAYFNKKKLGKYKYAIH